jgi:hypothetical protein
VLCLGLSYVAQELTGAPLAQATNMTFCTTDGDGHLYWPGSPLPFFSQDLSASREVWPHFALNAREHAAIA